MFVRIGAVAVAAVMLLGNGTALASSGSIAAARKASAFLKAQIHDDGGFGATESSVVSTAIAVISIKNAGDALPKSKTGQTPLDFLKTAAPTLTDPTKAVVVKNTAKIAHMIIALKIAGQDPKKFAGTDWVALLNKSSENATGWYGTTEIDHMWAMLALETAGEAVPTTTVNWLISNQETNGGYAVDKINGMGADTNSTALAIQALIGAGETKKDDSVKKAISFLKTQQNKDGGFPFVTPSQYGTDSDSSSTAWVIQALVSAGEDIESKAWVKAAVTPMGFLMSMQNADGGFMYQKTVPDSNLLSTSQAVPALMLKPFPYKPAVVKKAAPVAAKSPYGLYMVIGAIGILVLAVLLLVMIRKKP
jgi:prenyltransferase beta subunit